MRVLITAARFFPHFYGGGEVYVLSLAQELQRRGYNILVVTLAPWPGDSKEASTTMHATFEHVPVVELRFPPSSTTEGEKYAVNHLSMRQALKNVILEFSPDLIHINGINSATLMVAEELRLPTITTVHHAGFACPAGALSRPDNSICNYAVHASVCVPCCSVHRTPHWWTGGLLGRIPRWFYMQFGKKVDPIRNLPYVFRALRFPWLVEQIIGQMQLVWRLSQRYIAPSLAVKELLVRNGVDAERIRVVPHGIKPLQRREIQFNGKRKLRFGYVGQFSSIKGIHIIFEALRELKGADRCEIHFFGAPQGKDEEAYFIPLAKNYAGPAKIVEHGYVKGEGLQEAYASIDVLLYPSLLFETFGLVVNEALAVGRPVIVSRSGALPELVREGENGFIVDRNDAHNLSLAMQKCIDDPERIVSMSRNIHPVKTIHEYVDEVEKLYHSDPLGK
ncbi:MAG TPA: glycosyltransferase [Bacteroidota bacterium]|nr:glycosyltransferase [Bacteroidota bacterium]